MTKETNEFIEAAQYVHGDTYDYTQTVYRGPQLKVKITCSVHGHFLQMPEAHLAGFPCPDCSTQSVNIIGPAPVAPVAPAPLPKKPAAKKKAIPRTRKPKKK